MRKLVLAISLLLGCDAEVGAEPCTGLRCEEPPASLVVQLSVKYTRVSTQAPLDLPVVEAFESPCIAPCAEPVRLFRAMNNAAWTVSRDGGAPRLKLLRATDSTQEAALSIPEGGASVGSLYVDSGLDGQAVAHVSWKMPRGGTYEELATISSPGVQRPGVAIANSRSRPPRGAIAALAGRGFLLFDAPRDHKPGAMREELIPTGALRLVDNRGETTWQQARLPLGATFISTAVALSSGFVVGAADGGTANSSHGLLSVDAAGTLTRFGVSSDSTWRSTRLLPLGPDVYAVAAESELNAVVDTLNKGNIDIMIDRGDVNALTGFRLEKTCFFDLSVYGFSADDRGNLYVSSVTGEASVPRGLLCELPAVGKARCFQGQPNQLFGEIVATGDGALFVVAGDQILRAQLPPAP